jgi:hypothetical protein
MRAGLALVAFVLAAACQSVEPQVLRETRVDLPGTSYVSLARLADRLDLDYVRDDGGFIEMSAPPDYVVLAENSHSATVSGRRLSLGQPCLRRGSDYVLAAADADLVSATLATVRAGRAPAPPRTPRVAPEAIPPSGLPAELRPAAGVSVRPWRAIVIHHAAVRSGSAGTIHQAHLANGWDGLGYHFVIGNGTGSGDGEIEVGYRWRDQIKGAHTRARPGDDNRWNLSSIGICLMGDFTQTSPSQRQMDALVRLVRALMAEYSIAAENVVPHHFVHATECPGPCFPWGEFMSRIR